MENGKANSGSNPKGRPRIVAAEDAAMAAEEEARRKLREERSAERKEKVQQKIDELKGRLGVS